MKLSSLWVGVAVSLWSPEARAQEVLGFEEVLARVRQNNAAIAAVQAGVVVADGEVRKAWTGWQPTVNLGGQVIFNSVESKFDFLAGLTPEQIMMLPPDFRNQEPQVIQAHVQYGAALTASQTLFNISVLRAPAAAKAARNAAIARVDATEDDLLFQAATMYATIGGLRALETASERAIAVAEQRLKDAKVQLEAGTTTPLAITRAETDRVVAEGSRTAQRARRKAMLANLRALIGAEGELEIKDERIPEHAASGDFEKRSTITAKQLEVEAAEAQVGLSNLGWLPILTAEGSVRYSSVQGFASDDLVAQGIINLTIPIYDAGVRYANTDIAEARVVQARHQLEAERRIARAFLDEARSTLESAKAEAETAKAQLELAVQAVKQTEDLVAHGLATNLELTDADSKRYTADRTVVQRQLELDLAQLRAYYASGGRLLAK